MKMPDKEFIDQVKPIIKRIPGAQGLNKIRHKILRIRELSAFIKENRIVIFPSYPRLRNDFEPTREMANEVVKEWLDLYGIARLRGTTAIAVHSPPGAVLLYAPMALLKIPASHEEYLGLVERETRREIRLAARQGYKFREFLWNDHLDEIYEINTSKEVRQSEPMRGWYREPVQPRHHTKEELQNRKYYGAFKDEILYAYFHFWLCGDVAIGKHIIGHAQHLKDGIMNGLLSYSVQECVGNPQIRWLCYGNYNEGSSLDSFKKHAGFQGYAVLLDLEREPALLKYSEQKVRTIWHL